MFPFFHKCPLREWCHPCLRTTASKQTKHSPKFKHYYLTDVGDNNSTNILEKCLLYFAVNTYVVGLNSDSADIPKLKTLESWRRQHGSNRGVRIVGTVAMDSSAVLNKLVSVDGLLKFEKTFQSEKAAGSMSKSMQSECAWCELSTRTSTKALH